MAGMRGERVAAQAEHQMRNDSPGNPSGALHKHVGYGFTPRNTVLHCIGEGDGWIQMCSGNRPKSQNESDQHRAGRNRIRKQSNSDVAGCQTFTHDAGADHSSNEECATQEFSRQSGTQVEFHWWPILSISFLIASLLMVARGRQRNRLMRSSSVTNASRYARLISSAGPRTRAGSATAQ